MPQFRFFQICHSDETFASVPEGVEPLDTRGQDQSWYEFRPIVKYLRENPLRDDTWYGFLSPRFHEKTGFAPADVKAALSALPSEAEVYLCSADWPSIAYFPNCWLQGEKWHPGLIKTSRSFFNRTLGMNIEMRHALGHFGNTVFSNFVFGRKRYWEEWQRVAERLEDEAARRTVLGRQLRAASLHRGQYGAQMKVFVQERIACALLETMDFTVAHADYAQVPISSMLYAKSEGARKTLLACEKLKREAAGIGRRVDFATAPFTEVDHTMPDRTWSYRERYLPFLRAR